MKPQPLTQRQAEIAGYVAKGLPDKAIAQMTGLSIRTVQRHIENAAIKIPGPSSRRHRITLFFFQVSIVDGQPDDDLG